jgi:hypothetical protein
VFKNSIKAHFPSSTLDAERRIVYNIKEDIVDTIVGDMMFNLEDQDDSDADNDVDEEPAFDNADELNVLLMLNKAFIWPPTKLAILVAPKSS